MRADVEDFLLLTLGPGQQLIHPAPDCTCVNTSSRTRWPSCPSVPEMPEDRSAAGVATLGGDNVARPAPAPPQKPFRPPGGVALTRQSLVISARQPPSHPAAHGSPSMSHGGRPLRSG